MSKHDFEGRNYIIREKKKFSWHPEQSGERRKKAKEIYEKIIFSWFIGIIKSRSNKICDDDKRSFFWRRENKVFFCSSLRHHLHRNQIVLLIFNNFER